jgi:hypothetical protein
LNQPSVLEVRQMAGNIRLGIVQYVLNVAPAEFTVQQQIDDA